MYKNIINLDVDCLGIYSWHLNIIINIRKGREKKADTKTSNEIIS
jgi:hypothetical protein